MIRRRLVLRVAAAGCLLGAGVLAFVPSAAQGLAPMKTAWYDATGLQQYTGITTPSLAQNNQLEVAYVPISLSIPPVKLPNLPVTPPTLPPGLPISALPIPDGGEIGGETLGDTLAFGALEYDVPLDDNGQSIDPTSLRAILTLTLDSALSLGMQSGDLVACPTTNTLWASGSDQTISQAPPYDCSAGFGVSGNYDAGNHTVSFDLASGQEYQALSGPTGSFSVVIAPASSPSGPFTAVIQPPSASSFDLTAESPLGNANLNEAPGALSGPLGFGFSSGTGASLFPLPPIPPTFGTPPVPSSSISTTTAPSTGGTQASTTPLSATQTAYPGGLTSGPQRSIAIIVLVALAIGLALGTSNVSRAPRSLRTSSLDKTKHPS
jgi:hypothetical protein